MKTINWCGFSGSEKELKKWMLDIRDASEVYCRSSRSVDLSLEFEACLIEYASNNNLVGSIPNKKAMNYAANKVGIFRREELNDSYLSLRYFKDEESPEGSYLEQTVIDQTQSEDLLIDQIDRIVIEDNKIETGEALEIIEDNEFMMSQVEEAVITLNKLYGYTFVEISSYFGKYNGWANYIYRKYKKTQTRLNTAKEMIKDLKNQDDTFTQFDLALNIDWIKI